MSWLFSQYRFDELYQFDPTVWLTIQHLEMSEWNFEVFDRSGVCLCAFSPLKNSSNNLVIDIFDEDLVSDVVCVNIQHIIIP